MAVAVTVAVSGGGAVAVAVAGLTKRFFNHIQKDFLINVWGYNVCDVAQCLLVYIFRVLSHAFHHMVSVHVLVAHLSYDCTRRRDLFLRLNFWWSNLMFSVINCAPPC